MYFIYYILFLYKRSYTEFLFMFVIIIIINYNFNYNFFHKKTKLNKIEK